MQNYKSKSKILNFIFLTLIFAFFIAVGPISASTVYFSPEASQYNQGDVFKAEVILDTEGDNINLGEITVNFSAEYLEIANISIGNSIFDLWLKDPVFSNKEGFVSFIGAVPGGFTGKGELLSIYFKSKKEGQASVGFKEDSRILLNNGLGSRANLISIGANFFILPISSTVSSNEWEAQLIKDNMPPEDFEIKIEQIEGKYFAIFSTTDKESGIDRYEIKEGTGEWKTAASPYLLENQNLWSKISIKAIDKADNEKVSEITPQKLFLLRILASLLVLLVLATFSWIIFKKNKKGA